MLYFIAESGHDHRASPYEVLAAVAVRERDLWHLVQGVRAAEFEHFGVHLGDAGVELKGARLLKKKTFRHASEGAPIPAEERRALVRGLLLEGKKAAAENRPAQAGSRDLVAYGQAKLAFVEAVFRLMARHGVKTFAAIVDPDAPRSGNDHLRKDYAYLFERFFYHLGSVSPDEMGLVAIDDLEKPRSRILLNQMSRYFLETRTGCQRSDRIVPEPLLVPGDLAIAVQLADLVAYCTSWAVRLRSMPKPRREELKPLADMIFGLRFIGVRYDLEDGRDQPLYGMFHLDDLRPRIAR